MKIAQIGDTITWIFDDSVNVPKYLRGQKYSADVAMINLEEKHYGVYAEYGQDLIDFDKCEIINKSKK